MRFAVIEGDFTPYFRFAVFDSKTKKEVQYFNTKSHAEQTAAHLNKGAR